MKTMYAILLPEAENGEVTIHKTIFDPTKAKDTIRAVEELTKMEAIRDIATEFIDTNCWYRNLQNKPFLSLCPDQKEALSRMEVLLDPKQYSLTDYQKEKIEESIRDLEEELDGKEK